MFAVSCLNVEERKGEREAEEEGRGGGEGRRGGEEGRGGGESRVEQRRAKNGRGKERSRAE